MLAAGELLTAILLHLHANLVFPLSDLDSLTISSFCKCLMDKRFITDIHTIEDMYKINLKGDTGEHMGAGMVEKQP